MAGDRRSTRSSTFELILKDPALGSEYKRLVLLLPLHGTITYSLPKPSVSLTATEVTEIVAEVDPQDLELVKAAPMDFIRRNVFALHPDLKDSLAFYAMRVGKHPTAEKHEVQWQCIIKSPNEAAASHFGLKWSASGSSPRLPR